MFNDLYFFTANDGVDDYSRFALLKSEEKSVAVADSISYLSKRGIVITLWWLLFVWCEINVYYNT